MTPKEKLDKALGIEDGQSIDDFLDGLDADAQKLEAAMGEMDKTVKEKVEEIDGQLAKYQDDPETSGLEIANIGASLNEIADVVSTSKDLLRHVYDAIKSTDLVDPEVVDSYTHLVETIHLSIKEYVDLYRQRVAFYDKARLSMMQFEQKKQLLRMKYDLEEKLKEKIAQSKKEVIPENMKSFSQEDIIDALDDLPPETLS